VESDRERRELSLMRALAGANIFFLSISIVDIVADMPPNDEVTALLPLPLATFHILLALAEGDRHGYAIIQDVAVRTGGELKLSAGTLYRSIQRMLDDGLIEERRERPARDDDERRRYYRLTAFGRAVARAEARRLDQLLKLARASGLVLGKA
jgi:DNA-binding PadR family transcriptional regulator